MLWADLDARARGLSTRLIGGARLRRWTSAPDLTEIAAITVGELGQAAQTGSALVEAGVVERGMARLVGARLALLQQWAGPRAPALAALFEEEERRAVRALVRGVVVGIPVAARLAGVVPTRALPEAVLLALAAEPTVARLAAALARRRHPYGASLLAEVRTGQLHLLALEHCLDRVSANRIRAHASRADRSLREHAQFVIDIQNCWWAIILAGLPTTKERATPERWFLQGGRRLSAMIYERAVGTLSRAAAGTILAHAFPRTHLASTLRAGESVDALEDAALATALAAAHTIALAQPLSSAPIMAYVLRQRAELRDVQRLVWGRALAAPSQQILSEILSP